MNNKLLVSFILVLVSLVWAGSFIVVQIVTEEIDPVSLGFLRFLVATPIMFLILLIRGKGISIPRKEIPSLSILGLTGVTLLYLFQFIGIDITNASTAAVLINTNVIFIAILSALFLKETFGRKKISGVSLSFLGVIVIIFFNAPKETFLLENIFLLGCAFYSLHFVGRYIQLLANDSSKHMICLPSQPMHLPWGHFFTCLLSCQI